MSQVNENVIDQRMQLGLVRRLAWVLLHVACAAWKRSQLETAARELKDFSPDTDTNSDSDTDQEPEPDLDTDPALP